MDGWQFVDVDEQKVDEPLVEVLRRSRGAVGFREKIT
jgi:hypothetical protein